MTMQLVTARRGRIVFQPRKPMFWVYLGLLGYTAATLSADMAIRSAHMPAAFGVAAIVQLILGVCLYTVIRWLDLFETEPGALLAAAFVWGSVIATGLAVRANEGIEGLVLKLGDGDVAEHWGEAVAGPTSEEWLKGLGVIAIVVIGRAHIQRPMDGLVYGAMVGLGFQLAENLLYALNYAEVDPNDDLTAAWQVTLQRFVFGVGSHAAYTGIVGLGVGYAFTRTDRSPAKRLTVAAALFLAGGGLHFLWNSPALSDLGLVGKAVEQLFVIVFFVLVYRYGARYEFAWFRQAVRGEPPEVIDERDIDALRTRRARRKARRRARKLVGRGGRKLVRRLQDSQLLLAVVRDESPDPEHDPGVDSARREVLEARKALRAPNESML